MKDLIAGQKVKLNDLTQAGQITVGLRIDFSPSVDVDFSCFGVDENGQLSDDRYMVFFNQKQSPGQSIQIVAKESLDSETFRINLASLPKTIKKLVFTATIDANTSMGKMNSGYLRLSDGADDVARFEFNGQHFNQEKAIIIGEIYIKDIWRFGAVGQGFNGGLSALLAHFGGEEISEPEVNPEPPKVRLSKVTLEKRGDKQSISLEKTNTIQAIHINLNWDAGEPQKGFFGMAKNAPDLDLGCFYRMTDGTMGVIQPVGKNFGNKSQSPYILLDKDDRTGTANDGENLTIYRPDLVEFMIVFAMIYQGAADFSTVNGRVSIKDPRGNEIFIQLNAPDPKSRFCVAVSFKKNGAHFDLVKEEKYFAKGHKQADEYYGFGFTWTTGSK